MGKERFEGVRKIDGVNFYSEGQLSAREIVAREEGRKLEVSKLSDVIRWFRQYLFYPQKLWKDYPELRKEFEKEHIDLIRMSRIDIYEPTKWYQGWLFDKAFNEVINEQDNNPQ